MVIHACGVVPDDESFGLSFECDSSGLSRGGVHRRTAAVGVFVDVGSLVEENIHVFNPRNEPLGVHGVGAVGVASLRFRIAVVLGEEESACRHFMAERQ